jgi:hypothetical protein
MTTKAQLPEEATEEPQILSPAELADRTIARQEDSDENRDPGDAMNLANPESPRRIPGEPSAKPPEKKAQEREQHRATARGSRGV